MWGRHESKAVKSDDGKMKAHEKNNFVTEFSVVVQASDEYLIFWEIHPSDKSKRVDVRPHWD